MREAFVFDTKLTSSQYRGEICVRIRTTHLVAGLFWFAFLMMSGACRQATEPKPIPEPPDTARVKTQVDIPWPGLASSPWPMIFHDPQHTGRSPYRGPQLGQVEWLFNAGYWVFSSPAIDEAGMVYFGSNNNYLYAVLPNGALAWSKLHGGGNSSPLIASDGTVYTIGTGEMVGYANVCSFDKSGNLNWQYFAERGEFSASPSISKDGQTIYLASNYLYAIHKDGTLQWKARPDTTDSFIYSLAISPDGNTLYATGEKALYAMGSDGTSKWKMDGVFSNPAVDNDGNVYIAGGNGGSLYSFSKDGQIRWQRDDIYWGLEDPGPVVGGDGTIYISGQAVYAVDRAGHLKWKYDFVVNGIGMRSQCVPAIDIDGTIYVGKGTTRSPQDSINFVALNPNGTLKFAMSLRDPDGTVPDIDSRPAISADGKIYVGSDSPGYYLFKIK